MPSTIQLTLLTIPIGAIILSLLRSIYAALTSPMRVFPGPWYSKFTNLVLKYYVLNGKRLHYIHRLHQRYGSVVRIAPYEADFADLESFREIHKIANGFLKSPWYQSFRDQPALDIFTLTDPKAHAARRRLMARPFSYSSLREHWEDLVRDMTSLAVSRIRQDALQGKADIFKWWTLMAYDIVTRVSFGENPGLVKTGNKSREIEDLEVTMMLGGIRAEMKLLFDTILSIPVPSFRKIKNTAERVRMQGWKAVENANKQNLSMSNIFSGIVNQYDNGDGNLRGVDAACEAQSLIIAGSGTTAVTLTYLVWVVLQQPDLKRILEAECTKLQPGFSDADLEHMDLLNAVINETLRLYGAAPGSLPRIVPPQGATLGGYHVPGGVTVCTQAYSIHRNPDIFPNPDTFDHTRWLPGAPALDTQNAAFHPFGAGARTCLGIHLARMELRYAAAFFFRECSDTRLAESTTAASMEIENYFLIHPVSQRCEITMAS